MCGVYHGCAVIRGPQKNGRHHVIGSPSRPRAPKISRMTSLAEHAPFIGCTCAVHGAIILTLLLLCNKGRNTRGILAYVQGSTNGTNGLQISFMVLPMVPLALPVVPLVSQWYYWLPMVPLATNGTIGKITNSIIGRTPNRAIYTALYLTGGGFCRNPSKQ